MAVPRGETSSGLQFALCEIAADAFSSHQESVNCTLAAHGVPLHALAHRTRPEICHGDVDSAQVRNLQLVSLRAFICIATTQFPALSYMQSYFAFHASFFVFFRLLSATKLQLHTTPLVIFIARRCRCALNSQHIWSTAAVFLWPFMLSSKRLSLRAKLMHLSF